MNNVVNRVIRPSSRKASSAYRVAFEKKDISNGLVVNITHESLPFKGTYLFRQEDLKGYKSIHFKASELNGKVAIEWVQDVPFELQRA